MRLPIVHFDILGFGWKKSPAYDRLHQIERIIEGGIRMRIAVLLRRGILARSAAVPASANKDRLRQGVIQTTMKVCTEYALSAVRKAARTR